MVLGDPMPYHRLGLPPTDYPTAGAMELGLDLDARPSYAEVVALAVRDLALLEAR
jgi:hypothetical protein